MNRVTIPQIFENMEEATIGKWLRTEGDVIAPGDPLCELITEKTTLDLQSEVGGVLRRLVVPEKAVIPAGYIVALIGEADEELPDVDAENAATLAKKSESATADPEASNTSTGVTGLNVPSLTISVPKPAAAGGGAAGSRVRATPAALILSKKRVIPRPSSPLPSWRSMKPKSSSS